MDAQRRSETLRLLALTLMLGAWMPAHAGGATVDQLIALVRTSLRQNEPDKILAKSLHRISLSERLDPRIVEELESAGAGAETVEQLEFLSAASRTLPAPGQPAFSEPARPAADQQKQVFQEIAANGLHYAAGLPDFICTQVVRRYADIVAANMTPLTTPIPYHSGSGVWFLQDVLTVRLTYFGNVENYELVLVDGRKTRATYDSMRGAISHGDFGSVLLELLVPETKTQFQWDHWTHLRKRLTYVYAFRASKETSRHQIFTGATPSERRSVITGQHGFLYADDATHMIVRIRAEADSIPPVFPVRAASSVLDYDFADVGGHPFLLPLRSEIRMQADRIAYRNVSEFQEYRKFTGESTISFDIPETGKPPVKK